MSAKYGLTITEWQIMELLWSREEPMTFQEIMEYANTEWNKSWKARTKEDGDSEGREKAAFL